MITRGVLDANLEVIFAKFYYAFAPA